MIENFKKRIFDIPIEDRSSLLRAFFFFYFVLCSWYSIRPVRNEMAVQAGLENLPSLLSIVLLVMLIANPVYSWLVSRINRNKIVLYFYLFFILNLLVFFFSWVLLDESWKPLIAKSFYIWCNVFSFFCGLNLLGIHDQLFQWISGKALLWDHQCGWLNRRFLRLFDCESLLNTSLRISHFI